MGAQGIDGAAIIEEQAAAIRVLADTVAVFKRIEVLMDKIILGQAQVGGQRNDLILADIDGSRLTRATTAAPLALETNAGIKKIGTLLQKVRGFAVHGVSLPDPWRRFKCNGLFT